MVAPIHSLTPGRAWYLLRRDFERGFRASWHDHVTTRQILTRLRNDLPTLEKTPTDLPSVHVLTGQEQWLMSAWMLASWLHATERSWSVWIHDDGTLDRQSCDELHRLFPGIHIIGRRDADLHMAPVLAGQPNAIAYRARHPLALKCFDIPAMATGDRFIILDSDILFFQYPHHILEWASNSDDVSIWFNQDPQEPSPLSDAECQERLGFRLWPQVNSGLCLLHQSAIHFNQFEDWLGLSSIRKGLDWRKEQTLLALGASQLNQGGMLPSTYEVSFESHSRADAIARHYIGAVRSQFYAEGVRRLRTTLLR